MAAIAGVSAGASLLLGVLQQVSNVAQNAFQKPAAATPNSIPGLAGKLQTAVATALTSAAPGSDANQTIQSAIATTLNNELSGSSSTPASDPTSPQAFAALLKSFNINPTQFHQDFAAALQSVNATHGGKVDFGQLFKSLPAGSTLNATG